MATGSRRSQFARVDGGLQEARRMRAQAALDAGKVSAVADVPAAPITLAEFAGEWFARREGILRPATIEVHRNAYEKRIAPVLGELQLQDLTRERVDAWLVELVRTDPHRRAVEQATEALRAILASAVAWQRIATNPAAGLRMPKHATSLEDAAAERVLNEEAIARMLAATGSLRTETMLRAAVETGMRKGEIIGLRWSDVDLETRRLRVARSVWQAKGIAQRREQAPKNGKARLVAISQSLAQQLEELRREQPAVGADGLVWPGVAGRAMGRSTPSALLARVLKRAGLEDACSFHGLRHTAASRAFAAGVPILVISRQLGHATPLVTAKVYAHLVDGSQLDAFAAAMAPVVAGPVAGS